MITVFNNLIATIKDSFISIKRNKILSLITITILTITFLIFSIITLLIVNFNQQVNKTSQNIEVKIYLNDSISESDKKEIESYLKTNNNVIDFKYESKKYAFKTLEKSLRENKDLLTGYDIENNPLPNAYSITLNNSDIYREFSENIVKLPGIDNISNQENIMEALNKFIKIFKVISTVLFITFIFISVFLISNTIKLAIYTRRREIKIMKMIGSTEWFIRWPFIIEGAIIGLISATLSTIIIHTIYSLFYKYTLNLDISKILISPTNFIKFIVVVLIIFGIIIGTIGSYMSLNKFLVEEKI